MHRMLRAPPLGVQQPERLRMRASRCARGHGVQSTSLGTLHAGCRVSSSAQIAQIGQAHFVPPAACAQLPCCQPTMVAGAAVLRRPGSNPGPCPATRQGRSQCCCPAACSAPEQMNWPLGSKLSRTVSVRPATGRHLGPDRSAACAPTHGPSRVCRHGPAGTTPTRDEVQT